jgi:hypothetical protein
MTRQDPDIAALVARLGLRGMRYRSFGNRPASSPDVVPSSDAPGSAMGAIPPTTPAPPPVPAVVPMVAPPSAVAAPATPADFPLLAAALGVASATSAPAPTEATLVFLGLRTARTTQGR